MNLKYYSNGVETSGIKIKLNILKYGYDWDLFVSSFGLLINCGCNFKVIGVDEI